MSLVALAICAQCETLLRMEGETLSNRPISLPDDAHGKIALLVIGFSRKGGDATGAWRLRFKKDFGADPRYAVYPIAVLEDAPRLVRGMIKSGMRENTPKDEQDNFVILVHGEKDLKRVVEYSAPDDAYLLLIDRDGQIRWRGHGLFREDAYMPLRDAASKLGSQ